MKSQEIIISCIPYDVLLRGCTDPGGGCTDPGEGVYGSGGGAYGSGWSAHPSPPNLGTFYTTDSAKGVQ